MDKLDIGNLETTPVHLGKLSNVVKIGNLETTPVHLGKLSNVVKNDVIKKTECDELVIKVNNINTTDTSDLVKKLTITQKTMKFKRILLIIIMINILLLKNLIS